MCPENNDVIALGYGGGEHRFSQNKKNKIKKIPVRFTGVKKAHGSGTKEEIFILYVIFI